MKVMQTHDTDGGTPVNQHMVYFDVGDGWRGDLRKLAYPCHIL
jgi:hypothetical protein